ncbi:uromodulin-like isoform X2 [Hyperolius riggenbachi]|uniref:uromodulin-like isoform X2 n=1 Tax=Hyperolius riggenbachi TaxID=752182 RepID=UPI0035A31D11
MYRLYVALFLVSYGSAVFSYTTMKGSISTARSFSINREEKCAAQTESSSLTYLVDTTGSMSDDFQELKRVNSWLLDRVTARFPCGVRQYTMVEFNDPTVGPVRITQSKKEFGDFFNSLVATGGGDCPELAMEGLQLALENSPPKSFILVLTDASAKDYMNVTLMNNIYSLINTTQSQVFFLITGLCGSTANQDFLVYQNISALSFGHVFQVDLPDLNKVFHYLDFTLSRPSDSSARLFSAEFPAGNHSENFSIAENFTALVITTDGRLQSIQVHGPDKTVYNLKKIISELWGSMYILYNPGNGMWTIVIHAGSQSSVRVEGFTAVNISSADSCSKCHPNATCEDNVGSVQCSCKDGFIGDGFSCSDTDECAYAWTNNCTFGICQNTFGSYNCLCHSGYTSIPGSCIDINECSSPNLNRCHSSATCINYSGNYSCVCPNGYFGDGFHCEVNECLRKVCGAGTECIKTRGSYICTDPCLDNIIINEPWRSTSNVQLSRYNCDQDKNGWYHFVGSGGVRMPESCVPQQSCDTNAPVWLNGTHSIPSDGIVNRTVCASWSGNCCFWSTTVQIKACPGGYHVYRLTGTPGSACSLSYCTNPATSNTTSTIACEADEEWKLKNDDYGCYCKDKYEVSAVSDITPELTCDMTRMEASFHKCQLKSLNLNTSSLILRDGNCFGYQDNPSTNTLSILSPLQVGRCGLQVYTNATHAIYENTLHFTVKQTSIITRTEKLVFTVSCAYPLDMVISLNTVINPVLSSTNFSIGGTGEFTATMALYKDSSYTSPYGASHVTLSSKSILYVGVFIQGGDTSHYNLVMRNCYATPSARRDDPVKYYIIKDSCPNKQDSTIRVLGNGVSRQGRFSVEIFKFVGNYTSVYMHCAISLCDVTSGPCAPRCSGSRSRSASPNGDYQISVGPISLEGSAFQASGSAGSCASWAVLLGLVLHLLISIQYD